MNNMKIILRGFGQVFFQNNVWTGLLFLAGIFFNSWILGVGAILGNIISTFSAKILGYDKDDIKNGLYGFNGTLVGIAILFFFQINYITLVGIIVGAIISSLLMNVIKKRIPAYTSPFVISTWIIIYILLYFFPDYFLTSSSIVADKINIFESITKGFGEVMFQDNVITGLFFILGILINSPKYFYYALYGSILSLIIGYIFALPVLAINLGLFGYNAILSSMAFTEKKKALIFASVAVVLSVLFLIVFNTLGIIALTAPFVLATWVTLFISKKIFKLK